MTSPSEIPPDGTDATDNQVRKRRIPPSLIAQLWQLLRFSAIGGMAYIIDIGTYNLLRLNIDYFEDSPIKAKIVSVALATIASWIGNRYFTFRDERTASPRKEFLLFAIINVIGIAIQLVTLWISHYVLGFDSLLADNISGNFIGVGLGMIFRYLAYKNFVFTSGPQHETPQSPAADTTP